MLFNMFRKGFAYVFDESPVRIQNPAERAAFKQYQTYPFTAVNGAGQMVQQSGKFNPLHPMPLRAVANQVKEPVKGAGQVSGTTYLAPLIDTTGAQDSF